MNLYDFEDIEYKNFSMKLTTTKYPMIGVRIPVIRKLAKQLKSEEYLKNYKIDTYEEVMLLGMVIAKVEDEKTRLKYIKEYIKLIDCWSLCDAFCASLKFVKKELDKYFNFVIKYLDYKKTYYIRFGLVMLLDYYTDEKYLDTILDRIKQITNNDYYVKMAIAWLLCELTVYHKDRIESYILDLDKDIQKMYKGKVRDSFRIKE